MYKKSTHCWRDNVQIRAETSSVHVERKSGITGNRTGPQGASDEGRDPEIRISAFYCAL